VNIYDPERIYRDQINLPPRDANTTPVVRWVHVQPGGTEVDYVTAPADVRTIKVTLGRSRKGDRNIIEETITTGEWSPPGRGWELVNSGRGKILRWQRRRKRVWA
jgi:hypothetical protein